MCSGCEYRPLVDEKLTPQLAGRRNLPIASANQRSSLGEKSAAEAMAGVVAESSPSTLSDQARHHAPASSCWTSTIPEELCAAQFLGGTRRGLPQPARANEAEPDEAEALSSPTAQERAMTGGSAPQSPP